MALNPVQKLQILQEAKRHLVGRRVQTASDQVAIAAMAPGEVDAPLAALYAPMLTAFDAAIAQVTSLINGVTVTNADRVAYSQAAEAAAKV